VTVFSTVNVNIYLQYTVDNLMTPKSYTANTVKQRY